MIDMNDPRFEDLDLGELEELLDQSMDDGPPSHEYDKEFLRALALEIGRRKAAAREGRP